MKYLKDFIEEEIFKNTKKKEIPEKLNMLFKTFSANKDILNIVDSYYKTHVINDDLLSHEIKENIHTLLKRYWSILWDKNEIKQEDLSMMKQYFRFYTTNSQVKINQKIEKQLGPNFMLETNPISDVDKAILYYKNKDASLLEKTITNNKNITLVEYSKITNTINKNFLPGTLPLLYTVLNDSNNFKNECEIDYEILLKEPTKDLELIVLFYNKYLEKFDYSEVEELQNKFIHSKIIDNYLGISYYYDYTYSEDEEDIEQLYKTTILLFQFLYSLNNKDLELAFENIDMIFSIADNNSSYFKNDMKRNLNIESTGIRCLLDIMNYLNTKLGASWLEELLSLDPNKFDNKPQEEIFQIINEKMQKFYNYKMLDNKLPNEKEIIIKKNKI